MATTKKTKSRIEEHWLFAVWVIVLTVLPYLAFGSYMDGVSIVPKVVSFIILAGTAYIIYKHDPNLDKFKWACAIGIAAMAIWIMMQASQYKQDKKAGIAYTKSI